MKTTVTLIAMLFVCSCTKMILQDGVKPFIIEGSIDVVSHKIWYYKK